MNFSALPTRVQYTVRDIARKAAICVFITCVGDATV